MLLPKLYTELVTDLEEIGMTVFDPRGTLFDVHIWKFLFVFLDPGNGIGSWETWESFGDDATGLEALGFEG